MAVEHYENFPVASVLLPKRLRHAVEVIYNFARQADDFADEGDFSDAERLSKLNDFRAELSRISTNQKPNTPLFIELKKIIQHAAIPVQLFDDLLDAFSQDIVKKRYANYDELLDYCRRSANPVGRILLHLYGEATPQNLIYSDAICTSLQLINFWQDVKKDLAIDRIYLPQDEMARFGLTEIDLRNRQNKQAWQALMAFQTQRARDLMNSGKPLGTILTGRIGLEMRLIILGGLQILNKIEAVRYNVFEQRPVLNPFDWMKMLFKSVSFNLINRK
jgi:phytoene synthase